MAVRWLASGLVAGLIAARVEAGVAMPAHAYATIDLPNGYPVGIVVAPDGDVWFSQPGSDRIARLGVGGIDEFATTAGSSPALMTRSADGNIWFTERYGSAIGRVTPGGTVTEFPLPAANSYPLDITSGPDGNVWFTVPLSQGVASGSIGRITPSGTISEFAVDQPALGITRGPDNALWFTSPGADLSPGPAGAPLSPSAIGRMTTNGQSTIRPIEGRPFTLTTGVDGALWFTNDGDYAIGRLTTDGVLTKFYAPTLDGSEAPPQIMPRRIVRGPDDNLWFTTAAGGIWRVNQAGTMAEIQPFVAEDAATDIAAGVDGRMWFTQSERSRIGWLDALGFNTLNLAGGSPTGLARGTDDSIWFVDGGRSTIGRIGTDGSLLQYELGDDIPTAIAVGPDNTTWYTDVRHDSIGHLTAEGDVVRIVIPSPPSTPQDIVRGPDGNMWFTELDAGSLGRITPQGVIKRFPIAAEDGRVGPRVAGAVSQPVNLAVGPDGALWFTDQGLNAIGRMTTSGEVVTFPIPTADAYPAGIAAGGDGTLYFTESEPGRLARITLAGVITELGTPDPDSFPLNLTLGPDGAMWFTEFYGGRLGRLARDGRITKFALRGESVYPANIVSRSDGYLFIAMPRGGVIASTYLAASEPTRTATATATRTPTVPPGSTATATSPPNATPTAPRGGCAGDCDGSGDVSISEIIAAVNVALGNADYSTCANADADRSGEVLINDLIAAVSAALSGCPE